MGLGMYLTGEKFIWTDRGNPDLTPTQDGFPLECYQLRLGYWRKHSDLHGYIVKNFADGVDDCRSIYLGIEQMKQIIEAIESDQLPKTEGFFFGESINDLEQKNDAIRIFRKAIEWALISDDGHWRSVYYKASW